MVLLKNYGPTIFFKRHHLKQVQKVNGHFLRGIKLKRNNLVADKRSILYHKHYLLLFISCSSVQNSNFGHLYRGLLLYCFIKIRLYMEGVQFIGI